MGFVTRKKTKKIFDGTKLNVPGQGIGTKKLSPPEKIPFKDNKTPNTNSNTN
jgi:hypothetical protein